MPGPTPTRRWRHGGSRGRCKSYVHVGDVVEEGTLLIEFDVEKIKNAGYETDVMVIITQLSQYSLIHKTEADELTIQDVILDIQ